MRPTLIVLHYTAMASCAEARDRLCAPEHEVSAHWLISEAGETEALVDEAHRAWHAGAGEWAGLSDINSHSIGIEMANSGSQPFPEPQMAALERVLAGVLARWSIPPYRVIAHSDMAPLRKGDPGARFDWRRLALAGLSVWPKAGEAPPDSFAANTRVFGYPDAPQEAQLAAFRLRFRPWATGPLDRVDAGLAADLAQRYPAG
ncbi:N-acetylmuramoyl-L-alanine amidase [Fuscibacter oryzae]|uniref:N-acetylmuramoyl-L-alanine amidase n=1 Tax=Fuscibacter oryzae TaxID=2803939 RepID=A0A8J7ML27_9RHOB|nr:N-acetylmuramoyl-L-alanine amidase [Fuscibacter oryzae]MBL4926715.1 N-acetylmuramoyl-L-alanine amidase [Fuscibacter oryzae]